MVLKQAKVYTITSVKGGSGKTITTLNIAGLLSKKNKRVLIIDLDLYAGSISLLLKLNVKNDLFNLADDLNNNRFDRMEDYITTYNDYIDVIAAPKDPRTANKINSKYLSVIIAKAKLKYDTILIDTNHMLNEINLTAYDYSDYILYVVHNDLMTAKNMRTMVSIFGDMEKDNYRIILNEATGKKSYFTTYDFKHMMNDNIDYTIPESFYLKNMERYLFDGEIPILNKKVYIKNKKTITNLENMLQNLDPEIESISTKRRKRQSKKK